MPPEIRTGRLRFQLQNDFEHVQGDTDPFRRLAWLIRQQEIIVQRGGWKSDLPGMLGLEDPGELLRNCEDVLRDYHEIHCDPDFPRRLIKDGLKPHLRQVFISVLGEKEKGKDDYWEGFSDADIVEEIDNWLGFRRAALVTKGPGEGLIAALKKLEKACQRLNEPNLSRGDICGQVDEAFIQGETLLRQLLSFYGRAFYGPHYRNDILQEYDGEAEKKGKSAPDKSSLPALVSELGKSWALPGEERESAVRAFLEDLLRGTRKIKWPAQEAAKLRQWQTRGKGLGFLGYTQVLHSLDRWVKRACESQVDERGERFSQLFGRKSLFPGQDEAGQTISVPVKDGNRIVIHEGYRIEEKQVSPFVEILRRLNDVRPLYTHEADRAFIHETNLENIRDGAKKILEVFVGLWHSAQEGVFPPVAVVRRLLQIDATLVRLDYVAEDKPQLNCIRVAATYLPPYARQLLGQEAYLHHRDGQGGIVSKLALYPVDEELIEEEG
ncbi:MAG: hypothetical protein FJ026_10010 [Chloroflexi bacterium]|nr:hypothetical protein [Chloroflexota bacterium]